MNNNDDTKRFLIHRLKWLAIYTGISLTLIYLLPFPYDLISVLGLLVLVNILRARGGIKGIRNMFGSVSHPMPDSSHPYSSLKYYCMSCGKEHKDVTCPNCGSKMKRIG